MALSSGILAKLKNIFGKNNVLSRREECLPFSLDSKETGFTPLAVVFPENAAQISDLFKLASKENIYIIPRGAGTGTTGGAIPAKGGIVVSMMRMNKILYINKEDFYAEVEPGVFTGEFQKKVMEDGLFYPPDPASADFCTIGGNLAECAGGPKAVKYGVTRDYVLGLEVVLPTGEIIETGVRTVKGVVGYDFTRLIVGSEGTLGIITKARLKLLPLPESCETMTAFFPSMESAAKTVARIIAEGMKPRVLEYMDESSIEAVRDDVSFELPGEAKSLLIIESDGKENFVKEEIEAIASLCRNMGSLYIKMAENKSESDEIWNIRKSLSSSMFKFGPDKINEDIVVPRSRIPDVVQKLGEIAKATGLKVASFGHSGDGNIHVNIMLDKKDESMLSKALDSVEELFAYVVSIGGTLSGEHGVGTSKKDYIGIEIKRAERDLMRRVKNAFDPAHILNPGKIL